MASNPAAGAKLLVISDDFTGALDTAVQFSRCGVPARLLLELRSETLVEALSKAPVLVLDTESRHLAASEAARAVRKAVEDTLPYGPWRYYKKTDSLLRGNIAAEIVSLMAAAGILELFFAPAYPANGRTTRNGVQLCGDVPVHESAFAGDPLDPIATSSIPDLFKGTDVDTRVVSTQSVHEGSFTSRAADRQTGKTVTIFDSEREEDLKAIAGTLQSQGKLLYLAGCAGFASVLPEAFGGFSVKSAGAAAKEMGRGELLPRCAGADDIPDRLSLRETLSDVPLFVVTASTTPLTLRQIAAAEESGFHVHRLDWDRKIRAGSAAGGAGRRILESFSEQLGKGVPCILATGKPDLGKEREWLALRGGSQIAGRRELSAAIAANLAALTLEILGKTRLPAVMVIGGDTAFALTRAMGAASLLPLEEILPGVPLSVLKLTGGRCLCGTEILVSKSGGFGDEDTLVRLRNRLSGRKV